MGQSIRDYADINENLRYWFDRIFVSLPSAVFYDVGANDGVFTLGYASRCRVVHAFEPSEVAHRRLAERVVERGLGNVRMHRLALSDRNGETTLHRYTDDTFNSLYARGTDQLAHYSLGEASEESVRVARLDDVARDRNLPPPDVVKMDIEGAELFALRGGEATIRASMPVILVEYSVDNTGNAGYERTEISGLLSDWGYLVRGLFRNVDTTLRAGADLDHRSVWNLLCFPPTWEEEL